MLELGVSSLEAIARKNLWGHFKKRTIWISFYSTRKPQIEWPLFEDEKRPFFAEAEIRYIQNILHWSFSQYIFPILVETAGFFPCLPYCCDLSLWCFLRSRGTAVHAVVCMWYVSNVTPTQKMNLARGSRVGFISFLSILSHILLWKVNRQEMRFRSKGLA